MLLSLPRECKTDNRNLQTQQQFSCGLRPGATGLKEVSDRLIDVQATMELGQVPSPESHRNND